MEKRKVIIHISDSTFGNANIIDEWHRKRGFDRIGYHFVILNKNPFSSLRQLKFVDGMVETGRNIGIQGAHCKGHNDAIGICIIGKSGECTESQFSSLKHLIYDLKKLYDIEDVYQHSDFDNKKHYCAGLSENQMTELKEILNG